MDLQLSERQRMAVVSAITILSACVILAAVGLVIYGLSIFFARFSSVFLPLVVAAFLALVVKPYHEWFRARRAPPVVAVGLVFLSFLLPVVAFGWFFGSILVQQAVDLVSRMPELWQSAREWAETNTPRFIALLEEYQVSERLGEMVEGRQEEILGSLQTVGSSALEAGAGVLRWFAALASWIILPVYFGFFLMVSPRSNAVRDLLPFFKEETRDDVVFLFEQFVEIMVAFFRGQLIVAVLQGLLFAVGFSVVGLNYGFVLGLLLGLLNIVPYLGSIIGLSVCLPLAFFQDGGGIVMVVWIVVVFTAVQMIEAYLLTPRIMGERTGLHPIAIIVAIFFWGTALGGISGMILAIPLTAFGVVFWRLAREKYIREIV